MRQVWALTVTLAACYGPSVHPGAPCGPSGECPSGLDCIGGTCLPPGTLLDDAALDDGALADTTSVIADAPADADPSYVPWGTQVELTSLELPTTGESDPSMTMNRMTAVLVSDSPDDISECTRTALTDTFVCTVLTAVNSTSDDKSPEISADGSTLYFVSNRTGSYEVYMAIKAAGAWGMPTLVPQLSTTSNDRDVAISPDGLTAVVEHGNHFSISTRASTAVPFSNPIVHSELEITSDIAAPTITNGGAVIYFHVGGTRDLYVARRMGNGNYATPSPVAELNTSGRDAAPFVLQNDKYLVFERESDIFETTRP